MINLNSINSSNNLMMKFILHRVIVMDQGKINEIGDPNQLLSNQDSLFYGLAKEAGIL